ncbi:hypothetical protein FHA16_00020 [Escherichia coli]|uniref:IS1 family transposase n=1 Tax=Escherichia coli TaxID=562 RepID=UPI001C6FD8C7|nr:hypothetical protein [Escherichia coli]
MGVQVPPLAPIIFTSFLVSLARLGRKSLSFSKSVELHDKVIGHYLNIKHYQ